MAGIVKLNKQGLNNLINNIKENGGDTEELDILMAEVNDDESARRPVRRERAMRILVEEPTTEERLQEEVGGLFPGGIITGKILSEVIEMDRNYTLAELKKMAVEAGISPSGTKKEMAARLIAKGVK